MSIPNAVQALGWINSGAEITGGLDLLSLRLPAPAGRDKFLGWRAAGLFRPEVQIRVVAEATALPLNRGYRAYREARPALFVAWADDFQRGLGHKLSSKMGMRNSNLGRSGY